MSELKPCPFCGEKAEIKESWVYKGLYAVGCTNEGGCPAKNEEQDEQGGFSIEFKSRQEAIDNWNTRPLEASARLAGEREGVVLTLHKLKQALMAEGVYDNEKQQKRTERIINQLKSDYLKEVESGKID